MKVEEFGLGFPPRLFGKKIGETVYSVNLIPLGGFVKIAGEGSDAKDQEGSFSSKSVVRRMGVVVAGVVMNLVVAWVLVAVILMMGRSVLFDAPYTVWDGKEVRNSGVYVSDVMDESAAEHAGLQTGDRVRVLGSGPLVFVPRSLDGFHWFVERSKEKSTPLVLEYQRGNAIKAVELRARDSKIGVRVAYGGMISYGLTDAAGESFVLIGKGVATLFQGLGEAARDLVVTGEAPEDAAGIVGVTRIAGEQQEQGLSSYLLFLAIISLNLAVLNILPIPPLDGGKLAFLAIEAVRGSPVSQKTERAVQMIGFAFLITLILLLTIRDIIHL